MGAPYIYDVSRLRVNAFSYEDNNFGVCCGTGEYLLEFLKVVFTANFCLAVFAYCYPF